MRRRKLVFCLAAGGSLLFEASRLFRTATVAVAGAADTPLRIDVTLVTLPVTVTDTNGRLIHDLRREDFQIHDQGVSQEVNALWREVDLPLTVALLVDVSSSQMGLLTNHRNVVAQFLTQVIGPQDQAFIAIVNDQPRLLVDLTASPDELRRGVVQLEAKAPGGELFGEPCRGRPTKSHNPESCIGTPIWDTVFHSARGKLRPLPGRKAIILITDGIDSSASQHGLQDAIEAAQAASSPVYAIRYRSAAYLAQNPVIALTLPFDHGLDKLALETGGRLFANPRNHLAEIFTQIENELRSQYILAFAPHPPSDGRSFHKVEVRTKAKGFIVRAPKGYYPRS